MKKFEKTIEELIKAVSAIIWIIGFLVGSVLMVVLYKTGTVNSTGMDYIDKTIVSVVIGASFGTILWAIAYVGLYRRFLKDLSEEENAN